MHLFTSLHLLTMTITLASSTDSYGQVNQVIVDGVASMHIGIDHAIADMLSTSDK